LKIQVRLFAAARELAGRDTLEIELSAGSRIADLRAAVMKSCPVLAGIIPYVMFAVDAEYAQDATPLSENSEVACIPPVSGG